MKKPEILSPAGNREKLEFAIRYGADAVYLAGENFGLRSGAGNFSNEELAQAAGTIRAAGKKIYVTSNIFPRNADLKPMAAYFGFLNDIKVDAVIVSDMGAFNILKKEAPAVRAHISVQANNMNYGEALAWQGLGASRIILARELSFDEIREIREKCPGLELEIFVHGAICMSYSGRCMMSNYLTGRDPNRGDCSQPCRWSYKLMEEKRPGEYMDVVEDDRGTYIFNSKDLCSIRELHRFIEIGIDSFKIEGRMKSSYYAAVTAFAYKKAAENYLKDPGKYIFDEGLYGELENISHREYTNGFYFPGEGVNQNYKTSNYTSLKKYAGFIKKINGNKILASVKATLKLGDAVEIFSPDGSRGEIIIKGIAGIDLIEWTHTKNFSDYLLTVDTAAGLLPYSILRV
ncbi:MAG: peptidase U32 family protein [Candidatus Goldiibacteriota bacterium]|jgi:putative protease